MKVRGVATTALAASAILIAGCGGSGSSSGGASGGDIPAYNASEKVTISYWVPFTGGELNFVKDVVRGFEKSHPSIKVNVAGNINDEKIIAATRSGNVPDAALSFTTNNTGVFCKDGTFLNLGAAISRDGIDLNNFPEAQRKYTEFEGVRCVLPAMADTYGLYYNKHMFEQAGITAPPRTMSELAADAKKLTVRSGNSFKTVGFTPYIGFYENSAEHYGPLWNASWQLPNGKSAVGTDPGWAEMAEWIKQLVAWYGHSSLVRFQSGAGEEFSASNAFQTEKLAMGLDGEWRTALIKSEAPHLEYGTAPLPVADNQPQLYGSGFTIGNITGIPKGSPHPAAAWELIKYLATEVKPQVELTEDLGNIPTWIPALEKAKVKASPQFQTFLKIFANPHTTTPPITASGESMQKTLENYLEKYQAGEGGDLHKGLEGVASQIDAQEAQAKAGSTP
jgi:multiple sugar transport system substrate-binding protein